MKKILSLIQHRPIHQFQLEKSLNELVGFYDQSKDEDNKKFLNFEIKRLREKISELRRSLDNVNKPIIRYKTIQNYSWEQTNDSIKIYLNRSDLNENLSKELCKVELMDKDQTVSMMVDNAKLVIKNLAHPVKVSDDNLVKITKSFVIFDLKKIDAQKWSSLQKSTTKIDDFKNPKSDEDPSQSMMNLMKKVIVLLFYFCSIICFINLFFNFFQL